MVPDHHDANAVHPHFKKYVVGKFLEVAPPVSGWIEVLLFRALEDIINRIIQLRPETFRQIIRYPCIAAFDLTRLSRCDRMEEVIHSEFSVSASTVEFLACQSADFSRIHFFGAAGGFIVIHPMVHLIEGTQEECRQLGALLGG